MGSEMCIRDRGVFGVVVAGLQGELAAEVANPVVVDRLRPDVVRGRADLLLVDPVAIGGEEPGLVADDAHRGCR